MVLYPSRCLVQIHRIRAQTEEVLDEVRFIRHVGLVSKTFMTVHYSQGISRLKLNYEEELL